MEYQGSLRSPRCTHRVSVGSMSQETVPADEGAESLLDKGLKLEELGGSEPQVQDIPRRRYDI
jgi:hypothetical protein